MNKETKEALLLLLNSSSDEDDFVFDEFFTNGLSSDDSVEDEIEKDGKKCNFMHIIDEYSETDFKSHVGLNRSTVEQLIKQYSQSEFFSNVQRGGKQKIGARREVYLYVWYICNTITFKQLGNLFKIAKSSAWLSVGRVSSWLVEKAPEYIKWPLGDAVYESCRKFKAKTKLAGVIGVLDCKNITIASPKEKDLYYNSKGNYSLVLQAAVDSENKFIDICCGAPGSLHDREILMRSELYKRAQSHHDREFPNNTFLLAGLTYDATSWLVQPYEDNDQITDRQRSFNSLHSNAMVMIEKAFELLMKRFKRLTSFTEQMNLDSLNKIIMSACILHNFCIINNDEYTGIKEYNPDLPAEHRSSSKTSLPINRREILFDCLCEQNVI